MAKNFYVLKTLVIACCIFYVHDTSLTLDVYLHVLQQISSKVSHKNMYIVVTIVTVANSYTNLIPVVELQLNNAIKLITC